MVSDQLLFLSFILIVFLLLVLLALNIDLLNGFLSRGDSRKFMETWLDKNTITDISRQINLHVESESFRKTVISVCPVEAITLLAAPEQHFIVSKKRCLGYACLECLRLILLQQFEREKSLDDRKSTVEK